MHPMDGDCYVSCFSFMTLHCDDYLFPARVISCLFSGAAHTRGKLLQTVKNLAEGTLSGQKMVDAEKAAARQIARKKFFRSMQWYDPPRHIYMAHYSSTEYLFDCFHNCRLHIAYIGIGI